MATLKDVAELSGVSIATASNVITGAKPVRPAMKERVEKAMLELNYTPSRNGTNSRSKQTNTIGFIVSQLDSIFFPLVISGIQKIVTENNYNLIFYPTNYNGELEKKYVKNLISNKVDGIILDSVVSPSDTAYFQYLSHLQYNGKNIPLVSIQADMTSYGIPSVTLNSYYGGYMATEHLISKGCCKIACITGPLCAGWAVDRLKGYEQCLCDYNIPYNSSYVANGDCTPTSGYINTNNLLLNAVDFDGLFAENDLMAIGAIKALKEKNMNIPDDVKIVGYDNIFVATVTTPSITSIHIPKQRLGEEAARCLIQAIRGVPVPVEKIDLPLTLTERQTTNSDIPSNWDLYLV